MAWKTNRKTRHRFQGRSLFDHGYTDKQFHREIHGENATAAHESVRFADKYWDEARERRRRVKVLQAMNQEANRLKVMAYENPRISDPEKRKAEASYKIFRRWVDDHKGREGEAAA